MKGSSWVLDSAMSGSSVFLGFGADHLISSKRSPSGIDQVEKHKTMSGGVVG